MGRLYACGLFTCRLGDLGRGCLKSSGLEKGDIVEPYFKALRKAEYQSDSEPMGYQEGAGRVSMWPGSQLRGKPTKHVYHGNRMIAVGKLSRTTMAVVLAVLKMDFYLVRQFL
ncbi:hypothetical protein RRG08_042442 [Elysia crispata]|uniref:Uncharacterized protein n=1 Tax=Elysia crispata TaxID=231223 RepID=A0AAE1DDF8_9GAST|nr:hypothetical protein RRG08_042442 [Elysia crispata]